MDPLNEDIFPIKGGGDSSDRYVKILLKKQLLPNWRSHCLIVFGTCEAQNLGHGRCLPHGGCYDPKREMLITWKSGLEVQWCTKKRGVEKRMMQDFECMRLLQLGCVMRPSLNKNWLKARNKLRKTPPEHGCPLSFHRNVCSTFFPVFGREGFEKNLLCRTTKSMEKSWTVPWSHEYSP